ncbi:MAG: T9SS type A sorting domain-containing protein [Bacteroidetes bacterium]|nr:T9SS type A sorting domain-containing protein [Bacteroidota bacterium]
MRHLLLIISVCTSIFASAQSGITWGMMGMDIANNTHDNMQPHVAVDGSGNPLVIWGRMSDESVLFSRWIGNAFTAPVKLNPAWLTVATASWMGPAIAAKGDTVYVVVRQTPESTDTSKHIYIMRSFDGGVSFSAPILVDNIRDSISRFPAVTIDDNGNPIVAFMKFDLSFGDSRWVVTKSADFGNTFSTDVRASDYNGAGDEVCDCCPGTIISAGNVCAMLYRDNASNIRDMWTGISTNNATSFPSGFEVDTTNWMIMSCPSSGPDGIIIGDTLYSVFMSSGSGSFRVYLSKTLISTGALISHMPLTGVISGLTQQNYPRIANFGKAVAIVWKQNVSGATQLPMLFTNNIANGFPSMYDTVDLANETNTDVAVSNGKVYVVWQDDNTNTVKFRSGTFTPVVISSVTEISTNSFSIYPNPTNDYLNITSNNNRKFSLNIFNSIGEKVYSAISNGNSQLNTANWSSGIYFAHISTEGNSFVTKFIKQ